MLRRRALWILASVLMAFAGCAEGVAEEALDDSILQDDTPGGNDATPGDAGSGRSDGTSPVDGSDGSGPVSDASKDVEIETEPDSGCGGAHGGLGGMGVPTGSTASAIASYMSTPDLAADGNMATSWNSGNRSGSLMITFPAPLAVTGVRLAAGANPTSSIEYTVFGYKAGNLDEIGFALVNVPAGAPTLLPTIAVKADTYDAIRVLAWSNSSWVTYFEISMSTPMCP